MKAKQEVLKMKHIIVAVGAVAAVALGIVGIVQTTRRQQEKKNRPISCTANWLTLDFCFGCLWPFAKKTSMRCAVQIRGYGR